MKKAIWLSTVFIIAIVTFFLFHTGELQNLFSDISGKIKTQQRATELITTVQKKVNQVMTKTTVKDPGTEVKEDRSLVSGFINEARKKDGNIALQDEVLLDEIAQEWVGKILNKQKLDFTQSDLNAVSTTMRDKGFRYVTVAVNLALGLTGSNVFAALMKTKNNQDIITNNAYTHYGIGVLPSPQYGKVWLIISAEKIPDVVTIEEADEAVMFTLVNQERKKYKLPLLKLDQRLVKAARMKSCDIAENGYFDHISPTYGSPFDMMKKLGITYRMAAENLAGHQTVEQAHEGLMNSPGHRKNILTKEFTYIGIGVVKGSQYGKVFTQLFIQK